MKKYIIVILCCLLSWGFNVKAQGAAPPKHPVTTYTSEPCLHGGEIIDGKAVGTTVAGGEGPGKAQMQRYKCTVDADGYKDFISEIYKLIFFIALIGSVMLVVLYGILLTLSGVLPAADEFRNQVKGKIMDILLGLFGLGMIPWILKTIAPFIFK